MSSLPARNVHTSCFRFLLVKRLTELVDGANSAHDVAGQGTVFLLFRPSISYHCRCKKGSFLGSRFKIPPPKSWNINCNLLYNPAKEKRNCSGIICTLNLHLTLCLLLLLLFFLALQPFWLYFSQPRGGL